jgi:outer membrane receptor protein involved in Fe transport
VSSGSPYTIRTCFDDNRAAVPNDRPAGVGRNTERGEWHAVTDLRLGWMMLGEPQRGGRSEARGRGHERNLEIYAQISNLFNRTNYTRYTGVLTSDFFGEPTAAQPGRRFELGLRMSL